MEIKGIENDDRIYPLWRAAEVLGIGRSALWHKAKRGLIPHVIQGTPKQPRYYMTGRMIHQEIQKGVVRPKQQRKSND